jgi:hypothetical protein
MMMNCLDGEMENGIERSRMANERMNGFDFGNDRDVYGLVNGSESDLRSDFWELGNVHVDSVSVSVRESENGPWFH